ncbi:MAG: RHS repeat-associated core domain-containing protein [Candidatus Omnitrophota bacterium]
MGSQRVASVKTRGDLVTRTYYHSDHLGSSNVLTDQSGNQVALYEYSPFGEVSTRIENPGSSISYLFTGKELDDSTGLYFYGARYYDPEIGRFITPDSIVQAPSDPQSLNRYSYCRNNPVVYIDPTGHFFWFAAIIGAIVGATLGGVSAAINHQPIWQGILTGGISGLGAGFGLWMGVTWGAATGAGGSALMGGNPALGAGLGSFGAALGYGINSFLGEGAKFFPRLAGAAFTGAVVGGVGSVAYGDDFGEGAAWGAGYGAAGFGMGYGIAAGYETLNYSPERAGIADNLNPEFNSIRALSVNASDQESYRLGLRLVGGTNEYHGLLQRISTGDIREMGPGWDKYIKVFKYNPENRNSVIEAVLQGKTPQDTMAAIKNGTVTWSKPFNLSVSGVERSSSAYINAWGGERYMGGSFNSNYFINTQIYGGGANQPEVFLPVPPFSRIR